MGKITSRPTKKDPLLELQGRIEARFRPKVENIWQRLFRRFRSTMHTFWSPKDNTLVGRIHALNRDAEMISAQLRLIYTQLSEQLDTRLFHFVQGIMDPLLNDVKSIICELRSQNATVQAKGFQKYSVWVDKARSWIELYKHLGDKSMIVEAVVKHQIAELVERIKRDTQIISDYLEHMVSSLPASDKEKLEWRSQVQASVSICLKKLMDLTVYQGTISLEEIAAWKGEINKQRQRYFEEALQIIDALMEDNFPEFSSDEAQGHLLEVCSQIAFLEEQVPEIESELEHLEPKDPNNQRMIFSKLVSLEETAHRLNLDLRLTPDLTDRLELLLRFIHTAKVTLVA